MRSCNGWEKKEGAMNCRKEKEVIQLRKKNEFLNPCNVIFVCFVTFSYSLSLFRGFFRTTYNSRKSCPIHRLNFFVLFNYLLLLRRRDRNKRSQQEKEKKIS